MLCCTDRQDKILGLTRVPTQNVVSACKGVLGSIAEYRSEHRREYVRQWLVRATSRWRIFWRWLGFRQPTRRDALFDYYHGGTFPPHFDAIMSYGGQEEKCKKILRIANATQSYSMWISAEGASACRL